MWIAAFMAKYRKISIVIIAVYRSPCGHKAEFCEALNEFLNIVCEGNYEIVIAGDFNIDWYRDYYRTKLVSILNNIDLKQMVNEFTRITQSSKTLIDYIITNMGNITARTNVDNKIADNESIDILIEVGNECHAPENKASCVFTYNRNRFRSNRSMLEFEEMDDLNEYVGNFGWCLNNTVEHFTVRSRINREKRNEWFNSELRVLRRHKIIKYKKLLWRTVSMHGTTIGQ